MNREELSEKTNAEIREHASVVGVKLGALDNKNAMIDKILGEPVKAHPEERLSPLGGLYTIDVDKDGRNIGKKISGKKYKVTIFATESDKSDVDIAVNGYNLRIQRGKEVVIDEAYVEVLRNAVIDTVVQDPDSGERTSQRMMCYPHQAIPV